MPTPKYHRDYNQICVDSLTPKGAPVRCVLSLSHHIVMELTIRPLIGSNTRAEVCLLELVCRVKANRLRDPFSLPGHTMQVAATTYHLLS